MTKNISEKARWQAKISQCTKSAQKMLSIILADSIKHKFVTISRLRFSRRIGKCVKTIDRCSKQLQDLDLLIVKSGQLTHEYNIYIPNPVLFDLANDLKDKLFSLKQYVYESTNSFLQENVSPYIDNIRNQFNSSSSPIFFKKKLETVALAGHSLEKNLLSSVRWIANNWKSIKKTVNSGIPFYENLKNKLKKEEYSERLKKFTADSNDPSIDRMYNHIQFDTLGTIQGIDT